MRVPLFAAALVIATRAQALIIIEPPPLPPPPLPPPGCSTNTDCDPGPDLPCALGACVNGACVLKPARRGATCRPAAGICDVAEVCSGLSLDCPADEFASTKTECRAASGACDVAEHCTGKSAQCPADGVADSSVVCRAVAGPCDVEEHCPGNSKACPSDQFKNAGTICHAAANDCDLAEACTGASAACPSDTAVPTGTACENASACVSGGACAGPVCIGGQPELTFAPDLADFAQGVREMTILIKHTGSGAAITLTGANIDPADTFSITAAPQFPVALASGSQVQVTVRLADNAAAGEHSATLKVQANSCADQPMQLHANVVASTPGSGSPDAGSGGPSPAAGTTGSDKAGGGGCSSSGAPTATMALVGLAMLALRRRRAQILT